MDVLNAANRLRRPLSQVLDSVSAGWRPVVEAWRHGPAGRALLAHVQRRMDDGAVIYPARVLHALDLTPRERVRVVILGQDPYHGPGQAEGLAFSVPAGQKLPPSLRNIRKELQRDLGTAIHTDGHLGDWARQGVLLLNTSLTVEDSQPGSHAKRGWEALTDGIIAAVAADPGPKVFLLWGAHAQAKATLVASAGGSAAVEHLVLQSNHPSPLSATRGPVPFIGNGHFGAANRFLSANGQAPIRW